MQMEYDTYRPAFSLFVRSLSHFVKKNARRPPLTSHIIYQNKVNS